jgi:hypothetical protein
MDVKLLSVKVELDTRSLSDKEVRIKLKGELGINCKLEREELGINCKLEGEELGVNCKLFV